MKKCTKCQIVKPDSEFGIRTDRKPAIVLRSNCSSCCRLYAKSFREKNREIVLKKDKEKREKNRERVRYSSKKWESRNPDKVYEKRKRWSIANRGKVNLYATTRRAIKRKSIPAWADRDLIRDIYLEGNYQQLHVDHIVPLNSNRVCGLHWEGNLQLLSKSDNSKKAHRIWPNM